MALITDKPPTCNQVTSYDACLEDVQVEHRARELRATACKLRAVTCTETRALTVKVTQTQATPFTLA